MSKAHTGARPQGVDGGLAAAAAAAATAEIMRPAPGRGLGGGGRVGIGPGSLAAVLPIQAGDGVHVGWVTVRVTSLAVGIAAGHDARGGDDRVWSVQFVGVRPAAKVVVAGLADWAGIAALQAAVDHVVQLKVRAALIAARV